MTQETPNLGSVPPKQAARDAVHIAVVPVVAGEDLSPGDHVGLQEDKSAYLAGYDRNIGIVDPFLTEKVQKGQSFWLCLYPGTITSLRHVWTHPAFKSKELL